ncbi:NADPH-ferrihemoprotein reductase [Alternaria panax]|uniref:NADPH--cytochrome P450 reductase n=1 Tax=Alternaria panax TaxID=48097 RepID=A0AAD4NW06_9PLEO|nr:NADPH-ferrihemoprotein reductase [Alternaria panax]
MSSTPVFSSLKPSTTADGLAALIFLLTSLGCLTRGRIWDKPDPNYHVYFERPQVAEGSSGGRATTTRNVCERLDEGSYHCVIFWGSQSSTSERLAEKLGRECATRFGMSALGADLSDYDAESIANIQKKYFAIFIVSTYGEGDPSDNTVGLWDWIKQVGERKIRLENLRYLAFGLGNSNYKYYNRVLDVVADALDAAGATALIPRQRADDANGGTEEDYQAWKDDVFALLTQMGFQGKAVAYEPNIEVDLTAVSHGSEEYSAMSLHHQRSATNSAIVPLTIKHARELFMSGDRNCVHLEVDLGDMDIVYKTGDHIGVWPVNPEEEVNRLLDILGLQERRQERLTVTPKCDANKPRIPYPSTLETAFRSHLEICAPVARKAVLEVAQFAPTPGAESKLLDIAQDRERYERFTASTHITFARLLKLVSPGVAWSSIPLAFVLENLLPLQPRYYSISSSSVILPRRIAITALVVNKTITTADQSTATIHGLTSNYLLSTSNLQSAANTPVPVYHRSVESGDLQGQTILAHVRKSKFKLPITSSTQLILISAGTGFAPFRAFLQERAKLHAIGKPIGKMLLFFGCRNKSDYIYQDELVKMHDQLGEKLEIVTAFSRMQGQPKTYVQDRVAQLADKVLGMLESGANMYICGKASMAREVDMKLEEAVMKKKGVTEADVKVWAAALKKRGKWKADVWG